MKTACLTLLALSLLTPTPLEDPKPVNFGTLAGFDYTEGMALPKEVSALNEKKVTISGFMTTEDDSEGDVEYFVIVNDACGCEGTPMMNEMIFCAMPEGETTLLKAGSVEVTGKLYVGEEKEDGVVISLYAMEVESVK